MFLICQVSSGRYSFHVGKSPNQLSVFHQSLNTIIKIGTICTETCKFEVIDRPYEWLLLYRYPRFEFSGCCSFDLARKRASTLSLGLNSWCLWIEWARTRNG